MITWLSQNWGTLVCAAFILAVIVLVVLSMVRDKAAGKSQCGCNCAHCAMAGKCHAGKDKDRSASASGQK